VQLLRSNDGFTLTEVMVALVIMMVGMVGLLQAIGIALEHNLRNQLREEAVYVGEKYMNEMRGKKFESYSASYGPASYQSTRRGKGIAYTVERSVTPLSTSDNLTKLINVTVKWTFKKVEYQNRVTATVAQAPS
jgi:type IV pilus assembly protein PilV